MCIAVVATILDIDGTLARVDCMGNKMRIELGLVNASVGERVLVHAGCAIQVVSEREADEISRIFEEMAELNEQA
ncbi:MAG: HypC/HybG/HupF family hydrogenase formation chaperone [Clostridia bacterium]